MEKELAPIHSRNPMTPASKRPRPTQSASPASQGRSRRKTAPPKNGWGVNDVILWIGRLLTIALITIAPWMFGSVSFFSQWVLSCLATGGIWIAVLFLFRANKSERYLPCLVIPVLLGLLLIYGQTQTLPESLSETLASHQQQLFSQNTSPVDGELLGQTSDDTLTIPTRIAVDLDGATQAFQLLTVAVAGLLMGALFFHSSHGAVLLATLVAMNGFAISFFGFVQKLKFNGKLYWVVERVQGGHPFGPFVNRNNAGGFLLLCFACSLYLVFRAFSGETSRSRENFQGVETGGSLAQRCIRAAALQLADLNGLKIATLLISSTIFTGIVATISRGATLGLAIGLVLTGILMAMANHGKIIATLTVFFGLAAVGLVAWLGFGGEYTKRIDTLFEADLTTSDVRLQHWTDTAPAISDFAPAGCGIGSYDTVHRVYRSKAEDSIYYYAENQYFQTLVESGVVGLLLLVAAIALLGMCVHFIVRHGKSDRSIAVAVLGCFALLSQCVAATFDFGLWIPSNTVLMAVVCGFVCGQTHQLAARAQRTRRFLWRLPSILTITLVIGLAGLSTRAALTYYPSAQAEKFHTGHPVLENFETLNMSETNSRIDGLAHWLEIKPTDWGYRRLGDLWVHRFRLETFEYNLADAKNVGRIFDDEAVQSIWKTASSLDQKYALIYQAQLTGDIASANRLRNDPIAVKNLLPAIEAFQRSKKRSPLQPAVHVMLGQLHALSETPSADVPHLERGKQLAPTNEVNWFFCGMLELNSGRREQAKATLRRCLELKPKSYQKVVNLVLPILPKREIVEDILPATSTNLLTFAVAHLDTQATKSLQTETLLRVDELLQQVPGWDRKSLLEKVDVKIRLGKRSQAIESLYLLTPILFRTP